jgi:predicted nucleic-acid-binding Zn-ribbon protein
MDNTTPCPKCGAADGWNGPRYAVSEYSRGEWLNWQCRRCGYTAHTETCDATPPPTHIQIVDAPTASADLDRRLYWAMLMVAVPALIVLVYWVVVG